MCFDPESNNIKLILLSGASFSFYINFLRLFAVTCLARTRAETEAARREGPDGRRKCPTRSSRISSDRSTSRITLVIMALSVPLRQFSRGLREELACRVECSIVDDFTAFLKKTGFIRRLWKKTAKMAVLPNLMCGFKFHVSTLQPFQHSKQFFCINESFGFLAAEEPRVYSKFPVYPATHQPQYQQQGSQGSVYSNGTSYSESSTVEVRPQS